MASSEKLVTIAIGSLPLDRGDGVLIAPAVQDGTSAPPPKYGNRAKGDLKMGRLRWFRPTGYGAVKIFAAVVMLVAAALMGYGLATAPVIGNGILESRSFLIAVVEFELLFGLWLLSSVAPFPFWWEAQIESRWTWFASVMLFLVCACVSVYKALSGYASCGCFGPVTVNPWFTAMLNVVIVLLLLCYRPKRSGLRFNVVFKKVGVRRLELFAIWLSAGVPAGYAMRGISLASFSGAGSLVGNQKTLVLEPQKWVGKRFPLSGFIDIGDKVLNGTNG